MHYIMMALLAIAFPAWAEEGEWILSFQDSLSTEEIKAELNAKGLEPLLWYKSSKSVLVRQTDPSMSPEDHLDFHSGLVGAMPNFAIELQIAPSDQAYDRQYYQEVIEAPKAWDITTGSKDVVVAVIDTGINYRHQDLAPNMWKNPGETGLDAKGQDKATNGIDDDGNGLIDDVHGYDFGDDDGDPDDFHGHGTHCAGTIGARGNNEVGIAGLNWQVQIMALKFMPTDQSRARGSIGYAIAAIEYAADQGADVINASWGGPIKGPLPPNDPLRKAIEYFGEKGGVFVAAAGNYRQDNDGSAPLYPASYPLAHVVSVAASDGKDQLAPFSNYGRKSVDLFAPGVRIYSTAISRFSRNHYTHMDGTSMAAPLVAGALALLKSQFPNLSPAELKDRLLRNVEPTDAGRKYVASGGRLNIYRALMDEVL